MQYQSEPNRKYGKIGLETALPAPTSITIPKGLNHSARRSTNGIKHGFGVVNNIQAKNVFNVCQARHLFLKSMSAHRKPKSNNTTDDNLTLLHIAALEGKCAVVTFLLDHRFDINAVSKIGMTPLHSAAINNRSEVAKILLENGANPNAKNDLGGVPLLYAALNDYVETTKVLLKFKADMNIGDKNGGTPLHFAASKGSFRVVKLLIASGANLNAKDNDGKTPLDVATVETGNILRCHHAKLKKSAKKLPPDSPIWKN